MFYMSEKYLVIDDNSIVKSKSVWNSLVTAKSKSRPLLSSETKIEIHWNGRMGSGNFNKFNTALLLVCDIKWTHWLLNLNPADAKKMTP